MAEQDSSTQGNGAPPESQDAQVATFAQYIKDLSVESPSSPQVFQWQVQPQLDVQFNLNSEKAADDVYEVSIKIDVSARSENGVHFVVDLTYAGLFGLRNIPEEALGPILLVEAPRLLFPFARQIIADAVSNTGFPPLLLDPIDFTAAYVAQLQSMQQAEGGEAGGSGEPAPAEAESETNEG
jgi:preprotein translocase subunit SecB